jgi:hypothetical protein
MFDALLPLTRKKRRPQCLFFIHMQKRELYHRILYLFVCASDKNKYWFVPRVHLNVMREQTRALCTSWFDICSGGSQKSYNPLDKHNIRLGLHHCRRVLTLELSLSHLACICTYTLLVYWLSDADEVDGCVHECPFDA